MSLSEKIKEAKKKAEEAKEKIGRSSGPLQEPTLSEVAGLLDGLEQNIEQILDSGVSPSLDPPDAGEVDPSYSPSTLPEYAETCANLADSAYQESGNPPVDDESIGSDLKTIQNLLPGYRTVAGIT